MSLVNGVGAVMIYSNDPAALSEWYRRILGLETAYNQLDGCYYGEIKDSRSSATIHIGIYPAKDTLSEKNHAIMVNYRIDRFDEVLKELAAKGIPLQGKPLEEPYGRFAYISDPEGNPIELWTDNVKRS